MTGVKNLDGMLGTDIFYRLGLLAAAAALPGETACKTDIGLMMLPLVPGLMDLLKADTFVSYDPGPG